MTNDQIWDMTIIHNNPNRPLLATAFALIAAILPLAAAAQQYAGAAVIVPHDDVRINYLGAWDTTGGGTAAKQDAHETATNGDFYEFTFLGTGIEIVHQTVAEAATIHIYLDGKPAKKAECAGAAQAADVVIYQCDGLPYQLHTVKVVKASGARMTLRQIRVSGCKPYHEAPGNTFADRSKLLKASATYQYKNDFKLGLLYAIACFDAGKDKEGLELAADFARHQDKSKNVNSAFSCWPAAHIYFRYYDKLTPEVREGLKKKLTTDRSFGFVSTGNLFAMTAIPYYLAYEAFGKDAMSAPFATGNYHKLPQDQCNVPACRYWHAKGLDWSSFHDGRGRAIFLPLNGADKFYDYIPGHDPTARNYIENVMIGDVVREGLMEYNCWPYGADNILPYLTLAENTRDKELARKTLITYETILASTAANWLGGHWAAAQGRSYPNTFNQRPWLGTELFWPYFGGNPDARPGADYFDLMVAASRYRMPEYIAGAAQIRSGEYVSRTNFMKRRQYSFLNRRYAIYSQFDKGFPTDFNPRFGIVPQSKRTGIVWEGMQGATVFWVAHPLYSPKNGKMGTSGYGTSDRERTTQYKGTLVQTYNIPHEAEIFDGKAEYPTCPFTIACVPTNYLAVIDDGGKGRMFFHYKNVLIALTSSASFSWKLPAPTAGGEPGGVEYCQIPGYQFGVALETALPEEYAGPDPRRQLEAFRDDILAKSKPSYDAKTLTMSYIDRSGVRIDSGYDGFPSKINGGIVDRETWPEIANPWISQPWGGNLTFHDGQDTYLYDYGKWQVMRNPETQQTSNLPRS